MIGEYSERWFNQSKRQNSLESEVELLREDAAGKGNTVEDSIRPNGVTKKNKQQERESTKLKPTYVEDLLITLKYKKFGACLRYFSVYFQISSNTFYATTRTVFSIDDNDRQWSTIQIKGRDTYTSIPRDKNARSLGYMTLSEYDELLSEKESRKTTINRVVVVKEWGLLNCSPKTCGLTGIWRLW